MSVCTACLFTVSFPVTLALLQKEAVNTGVWLCGLLAKYLFSLGKQCRIIHTGEAGSKSRFPFRRSGRGPCHPFPSPRTGSAAALVVHRDRDGEQWVTLSWEWPRRAFPPPPWPGTACGFARLTFRSPGRISNTGAVLMEQQDHKHSYNPVGPCEPFIYYYHIFPMVSGHLQASLALTASPHPPTAQEPTSALRGGQSSPPLMPQHGWSWAPHRALLSQAHLRPMSRPSPVPREGPGAQGRGCPWCSLAALLLAGQWDRPRLHHCGPREPPASIVPWQVGTLMVWIQLLVVRPQEKSHLGTELSFC